MVPSTSQLVGMFALAALLTPPFILFIPHARQSIVFDRLLVISTFVIALLGEWLALSQWVEGYPDFRVGDVALTPMLAGAIGGIVILNLVLALLDRLDRPEVPLDNENPPED